MNIIIERTVSLCSAIYQECRRMQWYFVQKIGHTITLHVHKGLKFQFVPKGYITKLLYKQQLLVRFRKSFEYSTLTWIRSQLKPDSIVLDIGANIGLHSLIMAERLSTTGKVYAFEPIRNTYEILCNNIKINGLEDKIIPENIGFSDKNETLYFAIPATTTVKENEMDAFYAIDKQQKKGHISAQVVTLDSWFVEQNISKVDFIKIDVEGAELLCFQGAHQFFMTQKPIIIMECQESHLQKFEHSIFKTLEFLAQYGYSFEEVSDHNWIATPQK